MEYLDSAESEHRTLYREGNGLSPSLPRNLLSSGMMLAADNALDEEAKEDEIEDILVAVEEDGHENSAINVWK